MCRKKETAAFLFCDSPFCFERTGDRTLDPQIKSLLLYRLSYPPDAKLCISFFALLCNTCQNNLLVVAIIKVAETVLTEKSAFVVTFYNLRLTLSAWFPLFEVDKLTFVF